MAYHFPNPEFLSRRALAGVGIIALHGLVAYLLLSALMPAAHQSPTPRLIGRFITPPAVVAKEPPLIDLVAMATPQPPQVPAVPSITPPEDPPASVQALHETPAGSSGTSALLPLRVLGRHLLPDTEAYYPPELIREGVQGATEVRVCVDAGGLRAGEPVVQRSSGNARLDAGALNIARHGRYARAVRGDTPVGNCYLFNIVFRMR